MRSEAADVDIARLGDWIGRQEIGEDVVGLALARRFHATLDRPGAMPAVGDVVPPLLHFCLALPEVATAGLGADGHPARGGFLPPVPLPRRMWAGGAVTFHGDLRVGDRIRRVSTVADVTLKDGRSGPLCFVAVDHRIEVDGVAVVEERQDIVYRGADPSSAPPLVAAPPAEPGTHRRAVAASTPLLFRYSALTFNAHRIHYDRPYATAVEGYPGLVVQGPLQATLLADFAAEIGGRRPDRFDFRGRAPLFDGGVFHLEACEVPGGLRLWTAAEGGPVSMVAEAFWS